MVRKSLLVVFAIILLASLLATGCTGRQPVPLTDPVPSTANLIASVKINEILGDPDIAQAYEDAEKDPDMPQTLDEALDEMEEETGIDLRDFDDAVVFADIEAEDGYWGAYITGAVEEEELIEAIEQEIGQELSHEEYRGYDIYVDPAGETAVCFLDDTSFLVGAVDAVEDAIDAATGYVPGLEGPVLTLYEALGDVWVRVALEPPEETVEDIQEEAPFNTDMLGSVEAVGASLKKTGDVVAVDLRVCVSSPVFAEGLKVALAAGKTYYQIDADLPDNVLAVLEKVVLSRSGSCTVIALTATVDEIEEFVEGMQDEW